MMITTYKCDRCGRDISHTRVLHLTVDEPTILNGAFKIIKDGLSMDLCIDCYHELTKIPIDVFLKYFT